MDILLTGHEGFLGSEIYKVLTRENALAVQGLTVQTFEQWSRNFIDIQRLCGPVDVIIHCGAITDSGRTDNQLWQLNYQASCELARYAEETNAKLLFISSATAIEPSTPYGWSKHCAEFYMMQKVAGMNLCTFRPYNIWGFDESMKANPSIVYKILTRKLKEVYLQCTRDFIYISDVVDAVQQVIHNWTPGTYDIGTAQPTNISDLVNYLYNGSGVDCPKPPVVSECPVKEYLVANEYHLLPNWQATSISEHFEYLNKVMIDKKRYRMSEMLQDAHTVSCMGNIDYSAEDH